MKIIKRSGSEVTFDISKIMDAVSKANMEVVHSERLSEEQIETISNNVESICKEMNRSLSVEEIQDLVENQIMNFRAFSVARKYITYRYKRALVRKSNSTDKQILSLLECNNEEVKQENSNKNPTVNSVQRDYMAGEVSKDITRDSFSLQILWMRMSRDLYISMMQIILHNICTTAVLSILRICYRMEL